MLKKGASGGIYIHPWDITDEGIDRCFATLGDVCGLNELFLAAAYHANTFVLPRNPRHPVRWDEGSVFLTAQHPSWRGTCLRPIPGDNVDTSGYLANIVDAARRRDWGVLFFVVFHFSHSLARAYPGACCVDAFGERQRACLCPANPDVRGYDLALVDELLETYGGDGIRHESLGYGRWNYGAVIGSADPTPSPRDQFLLGLCFCGSCLHRAREAGLDPLPLRRAVCESVAANLARHPEAWDMGPADAEWAGNALAGQLWPYLEVRCDTVTSLYQEVQARTAKTGAAFMPFGPQPARDVLYGLDTRPLHPQLKRISVGVRGADPAAREANLRADIATAPGWAELEIMHNQRGFARLDDLREQVELARRLGVRHHSFHYYGLSRLHQLQWIGQLRDAWQ